MNVNRPVTRRQKNRDIPLAKAGNLASFLTRLPGGGKILWLSNEWDILEL